MKRLGITGVGNDTLNTKLQNAHALFGINPQLGGGEPTQKLTQLMWVITLPIAHYCLCFRGSFQSHWHIEDSKSAALLWAPPKAVRCGPMWQGVGFHWVVLGEITGGRRKERGKHGGGERKGHLGAQPWDSKRAREGCLIVIVLDPSNTCDSAHSWRFCSTAPLGNQAMT